MIEMYLSKIFFFTTFQLPCCFSYNFKVFMSSAALTAQDRAVAKFSQSARLRYQVQRLKVSLFVTRSIVLPSGIRKTNGRQKNSYNA